MPDFPNVIDSTMVVAFRACPTKFYKSFIQNLSSTPSVDLQFGGAVARGLEAGRKAFYAEGKSEDEAFTTMLHAALVYWDNFQPPEGHAKNMDSLLLALDTYHRQWPFSTDSVRPLFGDRGIEFSFALPLPIEHPNTGDPILYAGRFDMIAELSGLPHIVDEKTSGRSTTSQWAESWTLRNQFIGYCFAAQAQGIPVEHVLVRGISVLKTRIDLTQALVNIPSYMRIRWYDQLLRDVNRMVAAYNEGYFDLNLGDTCTAYGNCMFLPSCKAKVPDEWNSVYQSRTWHPLFRNPEGKA